MQVIRSRDKRLFICKEEDGKMTTEQEYLNLCKRVLQNGSNKEDRTETGTLSVFGHQMRFDLSKGFPIMTTKHVPFRVVAEELFWFIKGETQLKPLLEKQVNIWNEWAFEKWFSSDEYDGDLFQDDWKDKYNTSRDYYLSIRSEIVRFKNMILESEGFNKKWGDLGPIYGKQWRSWEGSDKIIDQLKNVMQSLKENPNSRRHIVSAWKPDEIEDMALPPCHILFQFYIADNKLSCQLYQRSGDVFLGIPFNIASYSLLVHLMAKSLGVEVGEFIHVIGDAHIYNNHIEKVEEQLDRTPKELPTLLIKEQKDLFDYTMEDIELIGYDPHGVIKAQVAI